MAKLESRWDLVDMTYPPTEKDEGGFGDEGAGLRLAPHDGFLQLEANGTFTAKRGAWDEKGTWTSPDLELVNDAGEKTSARLTPKGTLVRVDRDEEHGRTFELTYAAASAAPGLSKKLEARLERFWDGIVDNDNLDQRELFHLLEEGKGVRVRAKNRARLKALKGQ